MEQKLIQTAISSIEFDWENLLKEDEGYSSNYHYISIASMALKMKIHNFPIDFGRSNKKWQKCQTNIPKISQDPGRNEHFA